MDRKAAEAVLLDMARTLYGDDSFIVKVLEHPAEAELCTKRVRYGDVPPCECREFAEWDYSEMDYVAGKIHDDNCPALKALELFGSSDVARWARASSQSLRKREASERVAAEYEAMANELPIFEENEEFERDWEANGGDWADEMQEKLSKEK